MYSFFAGSRNVAAKLPCQQSMVNRVSLSRLFKSYDNANVTKAVWTFFANLRRQSANSESFCQHVTATVRVRLQEGNQSVHTFTQPAKLGWAEVDLSELFRSGLSSHQMWESLEIETSLTCKRCIAEAEQLPYLKLVDLGQMEQTLRLQHKNSQPLLALHVYDPVVVDLLNHGVGSQNIEAAHRTKRLAWFKERLKPCHRQEYRVAITRFPKYRNVVHPKMADIGKCGGSCSFDIITSSDMAGKVSEHAMLTAYHHLLNSHEAKALCVPSKYKPYHFIVEENRVYRNMFPDSLSVSECVCS